MGPSTILLDIGLMTMLVVVAVAIVRLRSLFAIVMLQGVYSLLCAAWFVSLDAVDVAFTEAAVGAGVSTVLMLAAMLLADRESKPVPMGRQIGPLIVVIFAGLAMFYAIGDMPAYGDPHSPANAYVGMDYIDRTAEEIHIPNVVTAVLASYRGFDTFGEAVVVFTAGLGVLLLLGLNGNAGKWRARPNGQWVGTDSAPAARKRMFPEETRSLEPRPDPFPEILEESVIPSEPKPVPTPQPKVTSKPKTVSTAKAKTTTRRKTASKAKPTPKTKTTTKPKTKVAAKPKPKAKAKPKTTKKPASKTVRNRTPKGKSS